MLSIRDPRALVVSAAALKRFWPIELGPSSFVMFSSFCDCKERFNFPAIVPKACAVSRAASKAFFPESPPVNGEAVPLSPGTVSTKAIIPPEPVVFLKLSMMVPS